MLTKGVAEWAFDDGSLDAGGVAWVEDHYLMVYGGYRRDDKSSTAHPGIATSPDGITWTKYTGNPVIAAPVGTCLLYEPADPSAPDKVWYDGAGRPCIGAMTSGMPLPPTGHWNTHGLA